MYLNLNNQSIYFQKVGTGKKPLIMLHGWKNDVTSFYNLIDLLKDEFTLYLIDLPGFGRSELPKKPFTVLDYAKVVNEFIDSEKLAKVNLFGHSLGGRVSIKLAAHYPDKLSRLILEASAGIRPAQDPPKKILYLFAKIFHYTVPNLFNLKEVLRQKFYSSLESDYLTAGAMTETLTNLLNEDLIPDLKKITTETLLIWGEDDQAVPVKYAKQMYGLIKNSRLEIFDNVGHFPHLEKPERVVNYVADFC